MIICELAPRKLCAAADVTGVASEGRRFGLLAHGLSIFRFVAVSGEELEVVAGHTAACADWFGFNVVDVDEPVRCSRWEVGFDEKHAMLRKLVHITPREVITAADMTGVASEGL